MEWIATKDRLPEFPAGKDFLYVIVSDAHGVRPMEYSRNVYAKTEKGRAPRWIRVFGGVADAPDYWMSLPNPPPQTDSSREKT